MANDTMNRRNFLEKALGATAAVAVAPSLLKVTDAFASGGAEPLGEIILDLNQSKFNKLKNPNGSIIYTPDPPNAARKMVITRVDASFFSVVSSVCTHQGCTVDPYDAVSQQISCGCHGSKYDISGAVTQGPASKPLKSYESVYDANANTLRIIDSVLDVSSSTGAILALNQNYPNPFTGKTTISFEIPSSANATLVITDVNGNEVATLHNGMLAAGRHELHFNGTALPTGTYFYKLSTPNGTLVKQMEIVR